jgi:hypothetical protein
VAGWELEGENKRGRGRGERCFMNHNGPLGGQDRCVMIHNTPVPVPNPPTPTSTPIILPLHLLSLVHKISNVPVVYLGLDVWILMGGIHFSGRLEVWALKSNLIQSSNAPRYGLLPHPNPYVPPHKNNRCINI